jgi:HEXXH motif-containing protein
LASAEALGVTPSAASAARSKRQLARNTLDSTVAMFDGLVESGCGTVEEFAGGYRVVHLLREHLTEDAEPADLVEPVFYEWYFRGVQLIKRGALTALADHVHTLPAIAVLALARAGALGGDDAEPLMIRVSEGPGLRLAERTVQCADGDLTAGPATVTASGDTLLVRQDGRVVAEIDWAAVAASGTLAVPGSRITFWQDSPALDRTVLAYQRDLARIHLDTTPFRVLSPAEVRSTEAGDHVASFAGGLDLIRRCWPELHREVSCLTDHFTLIEGTPFIGGSAISCLGVSFFKLRPAWSDVCYADHIVHEAAHQRLHVEFEVEPALENGAFVISASPIRRDPRPLHGVLHATFVFLRLSSFLLRVLEVEPTLEAERRLHRHALGLYAGLEQLERHGRWTPRGGQLFSEMHTAADHVRQHVPSPDPEKYSRLGPDYEPVSALAAAYHD